MPVENPEEKQLADKLMERLLQACGKLTHSPYNYRPTRFIEMLHEMGAVSACEEVIRLQGTPSGFEAVCEHNRLELSVEYIVLTGPWKSLISADALKIARKRLSELNYSYEEWMN